MSRVNLLPDNYVGSYLDRLEREVNELKSSLQLTGGSSLIYKQTDTGSTNDWSGTFTHGGGAVAYYQHFLITATAQTQGVLLADLVWLVWVNGVPKTLANLASLYTIDPYPKASNATNIQQWFVTVDWGNNTDTIAVKAYILATDNVTLTVQAVA
jgi:hypothetical protein